MYLLIFENSLLAIKAIPMLRKQVLLRYKKGCTSMVIAARAKIRMASLMLG